MNGLAAWREVRRQSQVGGLAAGREVRRQSQKNRHLSTKVREPA